MCPGFRLAGMQLATPESALPLRQVLCGVVVASARNLYRHAQQVHRAAPDWEQASYEGALWLASHVPVDARVASFDAGVLAYVAPRAVSNLDGFVGSAAFLRDRRAGVPLAEFLANQRIDFVVNVVADPDKEFARKGLKGEPGGVFEVRHQSQERVFVDGAWRSFVVLKRRD